jgi:hypothetical protein
MREGEALDEIATFSFACTLLDGDLKIVWNS